MYAALRAAYSGCFRVIHLWRPDMSIVHLIDEDGDDNVLELAAPDDDTESNIDFGVDPFEILADREVRIGTALYWQTSRRSE